MNDLRTKLGLAGIHPTIIGLGVTLYILIALILIVGLVVLIIGTIALPFDVSKSPKELRTDFLFSVLRLAGLTTVLGAVIALPFTIVRLGLSTQQTKTARDSLFNEKINAATQGLYARRQVTKAVAPGGSYKLHQDFWQDDIVQRCAAIDRLEGLAEENRDDVPRIARLLSVYVQEVSAEVPAHPAPKDATPKELQEWAKSLPKLRSDLEKAAQTLGRLNTFLQEPMDNGEIDLRDANLQRADLKDLDFRNARLSGAELQGADLRKAQFQKANFQQAHLQRADLSKAQLQNADLRGAHLDFANLTQAQLQRADLTGAQIQSANFFEAVLQRTVLAQTIGPKAEFLFARMQYAQLHRAQLQGADFRDANLRQAILNGAMLSGADLNVANLSGADLRGVEFDEKTCLLGANAEGAFFSSSDFRSISNRSLMLNFFAGSFGDASVILPDGITPGHEDWPHSWITTEGRQENAIDWQAWRKNNQIMHDWDLLKE